MERIINQRRAFDCAVAAAAMFAQCHYNDALLAAAKVVTKLETGLTVGEMVRVLRRLGCSVKRVQWNRVDVDCDTGLLIVNWNNPKIDYKHAVILRRGTLVDPSDSTVWDADDYLKVNKGRVGTLLVER